MDITSHRFSQQMWAQRGLLNGSRAGPVWQTVTQNLLHHLASLTYLHSWSCPEGVSHLTRCEQIWNDNETPRWIWMIFTVRLCSWCALKLFYFSTENKHTQGQSKRQHRPRGFKNSTCSTSSTTRGEGWHSSSQHSCSLWPASNIWCRRPKLGRRQVSRQCSQVISAERRGARQPERCQQVWGWFAHRRQEEDAVRHRRDETGEQIQTPG